METTKVLENPYNPTVDWTETEWNTFTNWLKGMLVVNDEVFVTFLKKDGSERLLRCTLNPNLLPKSELKESTRKQPTNTMAVFDLDNNGWRSFTIKSVKQVKFTIESKVDNK